MPKLKIFAILILFIFPLTLSARINLEIDSIEHLIRKNSAKKIKLELYISLLKLENLPELYIKNKVPIHRKNALQIAKNIGDSLSVFDIERLYANNLSNFLINFESVNKSLNRCKVIVDYIKVDSLNLKYLSSLGYYYIQKGNNKQALTLFNQIEHSASFKELNAQFLINTWFYLGYLYSELDNKENAQNYFEKCLILSIKKKDFSTIYEIYKNYASDLIISNDFTNALYCFNEALKYQKKSGKNPDAYLFFNLGVTYSLLKEYDKSIYNYLEAVKILNPESSYIYAFEVKNELGFNYLKLNQHKKAIPYFREVLEDPNVNNISIALARIGILMFQYKTEGKSYKTIPPESTLSSISDSGEFINLCLRIGDYFILTKNYYRAIEFYKKAYLTERPIGYANFLQTKITETLSALYSKINDYQNALKYNNKLIQLNAEIKDKSSANFGKLQFRMEDFIDETYKNEKKINEQEKKILQKNNQINRIYFFVLVTILVLTGILLFFKLRQQTVKKEIIHQSNLDKTIAVIEGDEEQKKQMSYFIHEKLSQDLISAKYELNNLEIKDKEGKLKQVSQNIDNSLNKLKEISYNLAPPTLEFMSINNVLDAYCEEVSNTHSVFINFQHIGDDINIEKKKQLAIYRIVQELVNNIIAHTNSKAALVQLINTKNQITINVEDTGKGNNNWQEGYGWKSIKHRMSLLNATHQIESNKNGTLVQILMNI